MQHWDCRFSKEWSLKTESRRIEMTSSIKNAGCPNDEVQILEAESWSGTQEALRLQVLQRTESRAIAVKHDQHYECRFSQEFKFKDLKFICLFIYFIYYLENIYSELYLYCLFMYVFIYLFICLFIYVFIYKYFYWNIYLFRQ